MATTGTTGTTGATRIARRFLGSTFAVAVIALSLVTPVAVQAEDQQGCGQNERLFLTRPCATKPSGPLQVEFGAAKLPAPPQAIRPAHQGPGFENVFARGLVTIGPSAKKDPIDCAMLKPIRGHHDQAMVKPPPAHIGHSGVILSVAPCSVK